MGLDLLPILPRALPSGSVAAVVGQRARSQQDCQNGRLVLAPLANLITRSFAEGKVPEGWKEARVVPVHKKGAKQDVKNYRPVSILRVGSKIMEDVVRGQLSKHFKIHSIIPPEQHGFQKSRSMAQQLTVRSLIGGRAKAKARWLAPYYLTCPRPFTWLTQTSWWQNSRYMDWR
jgi:hypothetical protein